MVGWRIALWAVIVLAALGFLYLVRGVLLPFVTALVISALLDPTIRKLRLRGMSRPASVWLVWGGFMAIIVGLAIWLTPTTSRQLGNFRDKLDDITAQLSEVNASQNFFLSWNPIIQAESADSAANQVDDFFAQYEDQLRRVGLPTTRKAAVAEYVEPYKNEITTAAQTFFSGLLGVVSGLGSQALLMLFVPVFVLFILLDLEKFKRRMASWVPPSIREETIKLAQDISEVFFKYLRGVTVVILWYIVIASILLTLLGAPYAILLAILFALIYLIPYLGPIVNAVLLVTLTGLSGTKENFFFAMPSSWTFAVTITAIYFVVMFFFDPLVYTRIVGNSVGLHPVVSFFVVFAGAALFGPIGMILAFPVAGSVKVILDRLLKITSSNVEDLELPSIPLRHRTA